MWCEHFHRSVTIRNDRGAQYRGMLRSVMSNGDVMVEVRGIMLTGRGGTGGEWVKLKKKEIQIITGPELIEGSNGE